MYTTNIDKVLNDAIGEFGQTAQLIHSMAECGEYVAAVGRFFQGRDSDLDSVTDEASDVIIMMLQVRLIVGAEKFDAALNSKLEKLASKMGNV